MTIRNLDSLLKPGSVAVIGASPTPGTVGSVLVKNLHLAGFVGPLHLVNPRHATIDGHAVYPDVAALPDTPDLAVIATPPSTVPGLISQLGQRGTRGVVVITAGFTGEEGSRLKQGMLDAAQPHLLRIVGPNCLGVLVPPLGLNASFAHLQPHSGGLAFIAQSGAILTSVIDWTRPSRIGFSHMVSLGDMADVDFGDLLDYLSTDPKTTAILMYVEMVTHARKFMSAARIAARTKPVVVIKAGRHIESARAVASHTGALAGSDLVYDAAFRRAGLLRVFDLEELFAAVQTLAMSATPAGDRILILTNGGGAGILATDALMDSGGRLAELSQGTRKRLDAVLPITWSRANPVDIIGDASPARYAAAMEALLEDQGSDAIVVLSCPTALSAGADAAHAVIRTLKDYRKPVFTCWLGGETAAEARRLFSDAHLPSYDTPEQAVRAAMHMVNYHRSQEQLMQTPPSISGELDCDKQAAQRVIERVLAEKREMLTAPESAAVLSAYRVPVNEVTTIATPQEAGREAERIGGRVALKILSPDITHKSDVGGVALDLEGGSAVAKTAESMLERVRAAQQSARITGFTIEPMVQAKSAYELIIGLSEDAQFGPVILFGQGGTATEIVADRALALPPLNTMLAQDLIGRTRIYKLLRGFRDRPPAALDAIVMTLLKVSQIAVDLPEVVELDINPLLASQTSVLALDARIRVRRAARPGSERLAIRPYPQQLEEIVHVDGMELLLRPVRPEDEPRFRDAFKKLSPETIHLRFFGLIRAMSHTMAARLTQIDYEREMALILTERKAAGLAQVFAVVRLLADPDGARAEFSIVVRDDLAGKGLGRLLMRRIIDYAIARGIGELFGDVLQGNSRMLDLAKRSGFQLELNDRSPPDVVRVVLKLK
jgi:acetyltransferase